MAGASKQRIEPGYCIVDTPGSLSSQGAMLFRNPHSETARYFMRLNADTPWLKPGQIVIVADPSTPPQAGPLQQLRSAKAQVNQALAPLDVTQASFLHRNYSTIATILNGSSAGLGLASDAGKQYFARIEDILKRVELTYQNQFRTQGTLIGQQFFVERNRLFSELKVLLDKPIFSQMTRKILNLRPYDSIRSALNLSSRSIAYEWSTAGVGAIKGYSTYLEGSSKAIRFMKGAGWIGLALSAASTTNDVYHACTVGREDECARVAMRDYGAFAGGVGGGISGGVLGAWAMGGICLAIGVPSGGAGTLVCAIVGGAMGSYGGAAAGEAGGKALGNHAANMLLR